MSGAVWRVVEPPTRAAVERRLMEGVVSLRGIARECDVSHEYVRLVRVAMEKNGVKVPRPRRGSMPFKPPVDVRELRRQLSAGKTREQVAAAMGISPRTVSRLKKVHRLDGLHGRAGRQIDDAEKTAIILEYERGASLHAVASAHGISAMRVRLLLQRLGVEIRTRGGHRRGGG